MKASFRFGAYSIILTMVLFLFVAGPAHASPGGDDRLCIERQYPEQEPDGSINYVFHMCDGRWISVQLEPPPAPFAAPYSPPPSVTGLNVVGGRIGAYASASAHAWPYANCSIAYKLPSGYFSTAQGLGAQTADANGSLYWSWFIGTNTTPGTGTVGAGCDTGNGNYVTAYSNIYVGY